jgi:phosphoglucomutase
MDSTVVAASAAVLGSLVGGAATIVTAWITQRTQTRRQAILTEIRKREALYANFISECAKLAIDALDHTLETPEKVIQVFALQNRIKLLSSDAVVAATDETIKRILQQYFDPNLSRDKMRQLAFSRIDEDPVRAFSQACRDELRELERRL